MGRAFLSHSSKQKGFVGIVADKLGKDNIVYDCWTFEQGEKTIDEILGGIANTDIFCFFISEQSLSSEWVKREIMEAGEKIALSHLKVFYPVIIDPNIQYSDPRIPEWMRNQYNIKYVSKPSKVAERIKQKFRQLGWENNPKTKKYNQLFIGRNDLRKAFEERIYDYEKIFPPIISVSGLPAIGRRKFITHVLKNANKIPESYSPVSVYLTSRNSIEDFILALYDLGYSDMERSIVQDLMQKDQNLKVDLATKLIAEIRQHEHVIYVLDNYSIIIEDGTLADWFHSIMKRIENTGKLNLVLISRARLKHYLIGHDESIFPLSIPELEPYERKALLTALLEIEELSLSLENFKSISELFNGFPEQVFFAFSMIRDEGPEVILNNPNLILEYNSEKVYALLNKYQNDDEAYSVLRLICEFDFISLNFLFTILVDIKPAVVTRIVEDLVNNFLIEFIGSSKEYVRASDAIRDFIYRSGSGIKEVYLKKIEDNAKSVIEQMESEDYSSYIISIQEALKKGDKIPNNLLIPSHFLNAMRELYVLENRYSDVISLGDRVLNNEKYLDAKIVKEIRYWLCLALCRKRDRRLLKEVQNIEGPDHNYLLGFYYRLTRNYEEAIKRFHAVLDLIPQSQKAKRELVQVYLSLEDFNSALGYARDVYDNDRSNPYNLQSYFRCLVKLFGRSRRAELTELLENLEKINNEKAKEMAIISRTQFSAYVEGNFYKSIQTIDEAIYLYPKNFYPFLTKIEVCRKFNDFHELEKTLQDVESKFGADSEVFSKISFLSAKAALMAYKGFYEEAIKFLNNKVRHRFTDKVYEKMLTEVEEIKMSSR